jgi:hypothetical protein
MPWRGPSYPGEFPTLGYLAGDWIEEWCVIPDGAHLGEPYKLTDEMWRFLIWHYRIRPQAKFDVDKPSSAFAYRRSQLVRPQKWGKGPFVSAIICNEAEGPALFDGWDANGEPVGRPWPTPWIQVTAASEGQTDNIWRALKPMIEEGPLADVIPDTGDTRINLPSGRVIEPTTASGRARLGQPITFAAQDEVHSWLERNGGWRLAETQRRNLAGMGGRSIETTNAWNPAEQSVAQRTAESAAVDIYRDMTQPVPGSINNKRELRKMLRSVYGDSWWVDIDRILAEFHELAEKDPAQGERYFLNLVKATSDSYFDGDAWDKGALAQRVKPGDVITVGFDGSESEARGHADETWLRACRLSDMYLFTPTFADGRKMRWKHPDDPELAKTWRVPRGEVNAAVEHLMRTYRVVRMYADPPRWQSEIDAWQLQHGEEVVIPWETYRSRQMSDALERLDTDVRQGEVVHDGDTEVAQQIRNAKKSPRQGGHTLIVKPSPEEKIDADMSTTLAYEAAYDAIAAGALAPQTSRSFSAY